MNTQNSNNKSNKLNKNPKAKEKEINKIDNISKKKKKKPSKVGHVVGTIFFINYKILSYILNIILTLMLIGIITGGIVVGAFFLYVKNYIDPYIDDLTTMSSESELTTVIYYTEYDDRINKIGPKFVEMDYLRGSQNRRWVKYVDIPHDLVWAFVALEDKRFFEHNGVDWLRTAKVTVDYFTKGGVAGGSTITQQLIKNMTDEADVRIQRKIQEILRAMYLESRTSKPEIMETYLNIVNLSSGCYGVQAAAYTFFNKDVSELNLIECAAIAAIVQSPTSMNPIRRPERNKVRRDECLKNMLEYGYITEEEFESAYDKELMINRPASSYVETVKSYYVDQVIEDVTNDLMKAYNYTKQMASYKVFSGGLKIYTCMDKFVQACMDSVYSNKDYFPHQSEGAIPYESAMVVLDPYNGNLLGIVGGRSEKVQRGLNRASGSRRPPGSSIKPVSIYAPAIERGIINYGSVIDDSPVMLSETNKLWPKNLPEEYWGLTTVSDAIRVSKNTVAVRVLQKLTPEYSFSFLRDELNVTSLVEQMLMPDGKTKTDIALSPLALGGMTDGISVYQLTAAYTMFANEGIYSKPRSYTVVKDQQGNTILDNQLEQKPVISRENACIMTKLLMGVVEEGTASGLGVEMKNNIQVAGKTGTTDEDYDRWFVGYTPYYLCGAWFGYDMPRYLGVERGRNNPPLLLFYYVMNTLHKERGLYENPKEFDNPMNVITAQYCKDSGMAPGPYCDLDFRTLLENKGSRIAVGYFSRGSEPIEPCNVHVKVQWDTVTRAVAGPGCSSANVIDIALVKNEEREFMATGIWDAPYIYREIPEDYIYPTNPNMPFYGNLSSYRKYAGAFNYRPLNSFCAEHNHDMTLPVFLRPKPEIIPETTEPPPPVKDNVVNPPKPPPEEKPTEPVKIIEETTKEIITIPAEIITEPPVIIVNPSEEPTIGQDENDGLIQDDPGYIINE